MSATTWPAHSGSEVGMGAFRAMLEIPIDEHPHQAVRVHRDERFLKMGPFHQVHGFLLDIEMIVGDQH
jgi:hypothetical protein